MLISLSGTDAADFNINSTSGELTFVAVPDFENPADADTQNDYEIIITADLASTEFDTQTVVITVLDLPMFGATEVPSTQATSDARFTENGAEYVYLGRYLGIHIVIGDLVDGTLMGITAGNLANTLAAVPSGWQLPNVLQSISMIGRSSGRITDGTTFPAGISVSGNNFTATLLSKQSSDTITNVIDFSSLGLLPSGNSNIFVWTREADTTDTQWLSFLAGQSPVGFHILSTSNTLSLNVLLLFVLE